MAREGAYGQLTDDLIELREDWSFELKIAREAALSAAHAIRDGLGQREIAAFRGLHDVQLTADIRAHEVITEHLRVFGDDRVISEESPGAPVDSWGQRTWLIDPLDGTNNFGFGIAHCAIALTLFPEQDPCLAVVLDPLLGREFVAVGGEILGQPVVRTTPLRHATISIVSGYAPACRARAAASERRLSGWCKRTVNLWAPSLDLALIASGALDGMICVGAELLDVAAGMYLLTCAGGVVVDALGHDVSPRSEHFAGSLTFAAARDRELAMSLLDYIE